MYRQTDRYIHTHVYTYIHTYMHTYRQVDSCYILIDIHINKYMFLIWSFYFLYKMIFHDIHARGLYCEFCKSIGYLCYENEPSNQSFRGEKIELCFSHHSIFFLSFFFLLFFPSLYLFLFSPPPPPPPLVKKKGCGRENKVFVFSLPQNGREYKKFLYLLPLNFWVFSVLIAIFG